MHRHQYSGRKLSRKAGARKLLLRNLATSLILYEKIKTTEAKAKEVRPLVERLITWAKKGDLASIRMIDKYILDKNAAKKLQQELAPIYQERKGGYVRIVKIGYRPGDGSLMAQLELLDTEKLDQKIAKEKPKKNAEVKKETKKSEPKKGQKKTTPKKVTVSKKKAEKK